MRLVTSMACAMAFCALLTVEAVANGPVGQAASHSAPGAERSGLVITIAESRAARRANQQARRKALDARRAGRRAERAGRNANRAQRTTRSPFRNPQPQLNEVLRSNRGTPAAESRAGREAARAGRKARDADRRARRETRQAERAERLRQKTRDLRDQQFRRNSRRK